MAERKSMAKNKRKKNEKLPEVKAAPGRSRSAYPERLKLLIVIVDRRKAEFYSDLLQGYDVNLQLFSLVQGTASTEIKQKLGLIDTENVAIFNIIRESMAGEALKMLEEKFRTVRRGKGIAFTIPFESVLGSKVYRFLSNNRMGMEE